MCKYELVQQGTEKIDDQILADLCVFIRFVFLRLRQRDLKRGNMWEYAQMKKHPDGKIWAVR